MSAASTIYRLIAELQAMNRTLAEDLQAVSTRLATAEADRDDYERRWLAECREHGAAKRRLMLAHHELGEHSLCDGDCSLDSDDRAYMARDHLESIISKP